MVKYIDYRKIPTQEVTIFCPCSSQDAVQRDLDPTVSSPRGGGAEETVFLLVQEGEVVHAASW